MTDDRRSRRSDVRPSRRHLLAATLGGLAGCMQFADDSQTMTEQQTPSDEPRQSVDEDGSTPTADEDGTDTQWQGPVRYAAPGEVQTTINQARITGQRSRVHLYPEREYDPDEPWVVRPDVTLDYNGAVVTATSDVDIHHVAPSGRVADPVVDLRDVAGGYDSSVFVFDSDRYGFYGNAPPWHVRGGITRGRTGEGTLLEFAQGGQEAIYFVHVDHAVWGIGTVVDMHRGDAFGINGNRIYGVWRGFERGIHMHNRRTPRRSIDNISGNHFDVIAQPKDSEILWDLERGHYNVLEGRLWDFDSYDDVMWRIHGGATENRNGNILQWFPVGGTADNINSIAAERNVFDDRLGDPRNRVVIPWRQGDPVADFD